MCLVINESEHRATKQFIPKTALEDLVCYKIVKEVTEGKKKKRTFETYIRQFPLHLKSVYTSNFNFDWAGEKVTEGLHSYQIGKILQIFRNEGGIKNGYKILKCIIPEGTKYYIGKNADLVAEKLAVLSVATKASILKDRKELKKKEGEDYPFYYIRSRYCTSDGL